MRYVGHTSSCEHFTVTNLPDEPGIVSVDDGGMVMAKTAAQAALAYPYAFHGLQRRQRTL